MKPCLRRIGHRYSKRGTADLMLTIFVALTVYVFPLLVLDARAQGLPAHVQADLLKQRLVDAMKDVNLPLILSTIDDLDRLKTPVAPTIRLTEAKAAEQSGEPVRAVEALEKYFGAVTRDESRYPEALAMYARLTALPEVNASLEAKKAEQNRQEDAKKLQALEEERKLLWDKTNFISKECEPLKREYYEAVDKACSKIGLGCRGIERMNSARAAFEKCEAPNTELYERANALSKKIDDLKSKK